MGCSCSRTPEQGIDKSLYKTRNSSKSKNKKKFISPLHDVNIVTGADGLSLKYSTLPSKKDPVVNEHSQDLQSNIRESIICILEKTTSSVNITDNLPALMEVDASPHLVKAKQVISNESLPEVDPSPRLVKSSRVISEIALTDKSAFESEQSLKSKELIDAKEELKRVYKDNKLKDHKILELIAENFKLKEHKTKRRLSISHSALELQDKASSLREKRQAIRKSAGISHSSEGCIIVSPSAFTPPTFRRLSISKVSFKELPELNPPQLSDEPSVSLFRNTVEEAKMDHAKQKSEKIEKQGETAWQYSELITL